MKHASQRYRIAITVLLIVVAGLLFYTYSCQNRFEQAKPHQVKPQVEQQSVQETSGSGIETERITVYWATYGEVYHLRMDCQALAKATIIHCGSIESSGKARVCKFCAQKASP